MLGSAAHDVFLNEAACWQNVPEKVWDYTVSGYQAIKKRLNCREMDLPAEAAHAGITFDELVVKILASAY